MVMPNANIAEKAAKILLDTKSVLFNAKQPFTLTSGKVSPVYVDCRRPIAFPEGRTFLMDEAAKLLRENCGSIDFAAGGETAGIPYAAFIADRLNCPMLYVRKKPKGFGRMAQIEGCMDEQGKNAVLIEDLQTDGGSKKIFIDALRNAGAVVAHSFVIFHYGIFKASLENMKAMNVELHNLTTWWEVLSVARNNNYFDSETLKAVESFLSDPVKWQADNAHLAQPKTGTEG